MLASRDPLITDKERHMTSEHGGCCCNHDDQHHTHESVGDVQLRDAANAPTVTACCGGGGATVDDDAPTSTSRNEHSTAVRSPS